MDTQTIRRLAPARPSAGGVLRRRSVVAAAAAVAAVRWWVSHERHVFHITPDEPGQLAIARFLGGAARWNMFDRSTWRPLYGALLAPLHRLTDDPVVAFRAALALNAVLGGVACAVLYLLARRLTPLRARVALAAAVAVSLSPAVLFTTSWTWSESLVAVMAPATLLLLIRFDERPSVGRGVGLAAAAAAGFATHSRLLPLVVVAAGLVVVEAGRRRIPWRDAGALVVVVGGSAWLVSVASAWLVERIWETPKETNTVGGVVDRLTDPGAIALSATGQIWYQLVATLGLAGLGLVALARAARRRNAAATVAPARLALVTCAALGGLAMVFMSDRLRPDQVVYGRYNDAVAGVLVVAGIGALVTTSRRSLARAAGGVVVATVVAAAVLAVWRADALAAGGAVRAMVLGLLPLAGSAATIELGPLTLVALVGVGVLALAVAVARRTGRPAGALAVLVPLLALGAVRTSEVVDRNVNTWALPETAWRRLDEALPDGAAVRFRIETDLVGFGPSWGDQRLRSMLYQFYLPDHAMSLDGSSTRTPYVFAPLGDPGLRGSGAEVLWRDPHLRMALWREIPAASSTDG